MDHGSNLFYTRRKVLCAVTQTGPLQALFAVPRHNTGRCVLLMFKQGVAEPLFCTEQGAPATLDADRVRKVLTGHGVDLAAWGVRDPRTDLDSIASEKATRMATQTVEANLLWDRSAGASPTEPRRLCLMTVTSRGLESQGVLSAYTRDLIFDGGLFVRGVARPVAGDELDAQFRKRRRHPDTMFVEREAHALHGADYFGRAHANSRPFVSLPQDADAPLSLF